MSATLNKLSGWPLSVAAYLGWLVVSLLIIGVAATLSSAESSGAAHDSWLIAGITVWGAVSIFSWDWAGRQSRSGLSAAMQLTFFGYIVLILFNSVT